MVREPDFEAIENEMNGFYHDGFWDGEYAFRARDRQDLEAKVHGLEVAGWLVVGAPQHVVEWEKSGAFVWPVEYYRFIMMPPRKGGMKDPDDPDHNPDA